MDDLYKQFAFDQHGTTGVLEELRGVLLEKRRIENRAPDAEYFDMLTQDEPTE